MSTNGAVMVQPSVAMTTEQRARLVGLIDGKILSDDVIIITENGEEFTIEFQGGELTFADLGTVEDRRDSDGQIVYGKNGNALRHFSAAMQLDKFETMQVIGQLIELADKPGWSNGYRQSAAPTGGRRRSAAAPQQQRQSRSAAAPQQQPDLEALVAAAVAAAIKNLVPATPEPAKVEPAVKPVRGHRKVRSTATAVEVAPVPVALEPGQTVTWQGKLYELTLQANGRIGQTKA